MHTAALATFLSRKGQIVTVSWRRPMKTYAHVRATVEKAVTIQARAGVTYDHMSDVIHKRATGELPKENQGLPWGRWATMAGASLFPHVIEHKGSHYLRFAKLSDATQGKVEYFIDGQRADAGHVASLTQASEWQDKKGDVFNVRAENITRIA